MLEDVRAGPFAGQQAPSMVAVGGGQAQDLGEPQFRGVVFRVSVSVLDPRKLPGQGVPIEVHFKQGSGSFQLLGRQTVAVVSPLYTTGEHPELIEPVGLQGSMVNLESGELLHSVDLFAAQGPGLPMAMGLDYHSSNSGYWKAMATQSDSSEFVYAPFGHGWTSLLTTRLVREEYEERTGSLPGTIVSREETWAFQDANGRHVNFNFSFSGSTSLAGEGTKYGLSAAFGVPYASIVVKELPSGGHKLSAPSSPMVLTFDDEGRLTEVRRRDHGRALTLAHSASAVVITDSQGRTMTWTLGNNLVTQITDPASRVWYLSYQGSSLVGIRQVGGPEYFFGYDSTSYHLSHATGPTGLVTSFSYRDPTTSPDTGGPVDERVMAYSLTQATEATASRTLSHTRTPTGYLVATADSLGRTATHEARTLYLNQSAYPIGVRSDWTSLQGSGTSTPWSRQFNATISGSTIGVSVPIGGKATRITRSMWQGGDTLFVRRAGTFPSPTDLTLLDVQIDPNGFWPTSSLSADRRTYLHTNVQTKQGGLVEGLVGTLSWDIGGATATTNTVYNDDGEATSVENAIGIKSTVARSTTQGQRGLADSQTTEPRGPQPWQEAPITVRFQYDAMGQVTRSTDPAGQETIYRYTNLDQLEEVLDPTGRTTLNEFDVAGRPTRSSSNHGDQATYEYDDSPTGFGLLRRVSVAGLGDTLYERDSMGHLAKIISPRLEETRYVYNSRWLLEKTEFWARENGGSLQHRRTVAYTYDARGNVTKQTRTEELTSPRRTYETDVSYDAQDQPTQIEYPEVTQGGTVWRPKAYPYYDETLPFGLVQEVAPAATPTGFPESELPYELQRDAGKRVTHVVQGFNALSSRSRVDLDAAGNAETVYSADHDFTGPPTSTVPTDRPRTRTTRDDFARVTEVRNAANQLVSDVEFDAAGRRTRVRQADSSGTLHAVETTTYHSTTGQVDEVTGFARSGTSARTKYFYDSAGRFKKSHLFDGNNSLITVSEVWYDSVGRVERSQSRNREINATEVRDIKVEFDPATGDVTKQIQVVNGSEFTWSYTYGIGGRPESTTDPLGKTTTLEYDEQDRLKTRVKRDGVRINFTYDEWDRLKTVSGPTETITYEYDAANRMLEEANQKYRRVCTYDKLGRKTSVAVTYLQELPVTTRTFTYTYDKSVHRYGGLTKLTDPEGLETDYTYTQEFELAEIKQRPAGGAQTTVASFAYDSANRIKQWSVEGGAAGSWQRDYDATGQITRQWGATPNHDIAYTHDSFGRKLSATYKHLNGSGSGPGLKYEWRYDGIGRMFDEKVSLGNGAPVFREQLTFDNAGNRTSRLKNGKRTDFTYNAFNQLTSANRIVPTPITLAGLTATASSTSQAPGSHGPDLAIDGVVPSPPTSGAGDAFVSDNLVGEHWLEVSTSAIETLDGVEIHLPTDRSFPDKLYLEYRDSSNAWVAIPVVSIEGAEVDMNAGAQDGLLPDASNVTVSFAPVATNEIRVRQPAEATATELAVMELRLFKVGGSTTVSTGYSYDDNGNMISATSPGHTRSFAYDHDDRLTSIVDAGGSGGPVNIAMDHCPSGQLMQQTVGGVQERFLYEGAEIYSGYAGVGSTLSKRYVHGPGLDRKVGVVSYSGGTPDLPKYFFAEGNGTTHQVVEFDPPGGGGSGLSTTVETSVYSAWGEPILADRVPGLLNAAVPVASTFSTEFSYTGRRKLGNSGLLDYRNRIYDPELGRFLTSDPIGTEAGMNTYEYVTGDPTNNTDSMGLSPDTGKGGCGCRWGGPETLFPPIPNQRDCWDFDFKSLDTPSQDSGSMGPPTIVDQYREEAREAREALLEATFRLNPSHSPIDTSSAGYRREVAHMNFWLDKIGAEVRRGFRYWLSPTLHKRVRSYLWAYTGARLRVDWIKAWDKNEQARDSHEIAKALSSTCARHTKRVPVPSKRKVSGQVQTDESFVCLRCKPGVGDPNMRALEWAYNESPGARLETAIWNGALHLPGTLFGFLGGGPDGVTDYFKRYGTPDFAPKKRGVRWRKVDHCNDCHRSPFTVPGLPPCKHKSKRKSGR